MESQKPSLSPEGTNRSHGENKNMSKCTNENPPTVAKRSRCIIFQNIGVDYLKVFKWIESNPPVQISK